MEVGFKRGDIETLHQLCSTCKPASKLVKLHFTIKETLKQKFSKKNTDKFLKYQLLYIIQLLQKNIC